MSKARVASSAEPSRFEPVEMNDADLIPVETLDRSKPKRRGGTRIPWRTIQIATMLGALILIVASARWEWNWGTFSSFGWGPFQIACPLGVAQVIAATQEFIPALALAGLAGVLVTIIFGRAFCGWICPGRWIFNCAPRTAPKPWAARPWIQTGIVAGVIGLSWVCHNPLFCVICPVGGICRGAIGLNTGGNWLSSVGWLGAIIGMEWLSRRSWCRDLCPVGALLSRISVLNPFLKVRANPEKCHPCLVCMKKCPEGINLSKNPDLATCTKCFACQSACPRGGVEITFWNHAK
jgi:ferredoxin-type protein NapH